MTKQSTRKTIQVKSIALLLALSMLIPLMPFRAIAATSEEDLTVNETEQTTVSEKQTETPLDAIIVEEDVSKRGRNEKHFLCDDGSYIAISYSEDVHEIVNNEWVDIEYDVDESNDEISPVDEDIKVKFANNTNSSKLVKLEADGYKISWTVEAETEDGEGINKVKLSKESKSAIKTTKDINKQNKEKIKAESKHTYAQVLSYKQMAELAIEKEKSADVENNEKVLYANASIEEYNREQIQSAASYAQSMVEYKDAFGEGLTLRYLLTPGKINEEIVLDSYSGFKSYSMVINTDGLTPVVSENGSVALTDEEGNAVMNIAAPYMYDAVDAISENVSVTATQENKKEWRVTYTPDQEWLKDTNRVYPVVIDPTVTTHNYAQDLFSDTYVYEGQTTAVSNSGCYLYFGHDGDGKEYITYWGSSTEYPGGVSPDSVTAVNIYFKGANTLAGMGMVELYYTGDLTLETYQMTWYDRPSFQTLYGTVLTSYDNWLVFSPSELIDDAIDSYIDSWKIGIFAIKKKYKTNSTEPFRLYSSNYRPNGATSYIPYIEVLYTGDSTGSGTGSNLDYPTGYTTEIESGTYIIENMYNGRYLHHSEGNNTVNVWNYGEHPYQKWDVQKNSDGTYSFKSLSTNNPNAFMEVYYGQNVDTQPITMYASSDAVFSNAYKYFLIKNADLTYSIMPALSGDKVLAVYSGSNYEAIYNERVFEKTGGITVHLSEKNNSSEQKWRIHNIDSFDWDTSLQNGTYTIQNVAMETVLMHNVNSNVAVASAYSKLASMRWHVTQTDTSGIYLFSPASNPSYNLELYYASISGACKDGHPFTLNNYTNNQGSPYIKMRLKKDADGNYTIHPLVTPTKCIEVYCGEDTTYTFNGRTFEKNSGEYVQLAESTGNSIQKWTFEPLIGIEPEVVELYIGEWFDLDTVEAFPSTSTPINWTCVSGEDYIEHNSETNEVLAKKAGTAVFQTILSDGLYYQFSIVVQELTSLVQGDYYIINVSSGKYLDMDTSNQIDSSYYLTQNELDYYSPSQIWKLTYNSSDGMYRLQSNYDAGSPLYAGVPHNSSQEIPVQTTDFPTIAYGWYIVPASSQDSFYIISYNDPSKRMSVSSNSSGASVITQPITNNTKQEWRLIKAENQSAVLAEEVSIGDKREFDISTNQCFKWYKITATSDNYKNILVELTSPEDEETDYEDDYISNFIAIYIGEANNPNQLIGITKTNYAVDECVINLSDFSGERTFYIKISCDTTDNNIQSERLSVSFKNSTIRYGDEVKGYKYLERHKIPTCIYFLDDSMYNYSVLETENGVQVSYTYAQLFEIAVGQWNSIDVKGDGTPMFLIMNDHSVAQSTISVKEIPDAHFAGINYSFDNDIELNETQIIQKGRKTKTNLIDLMCHELGHTVGLADLYIRDAHGYYYNGILIDNSDHLMYGKGYGTQKNTEYFHDDDIEGAKNLHSYYSMVEYTIEEIHEKADIVVKGCVDHTSGCGDYTRVHLMVQEFIYSKENYDLSNIITFLQFGNEEINLYIDPLYSEGEEYILYLYFGANDELFVVGGPQGRFLVEEDESGETTVTNQIDRIVEKEAKEKYKLEKKFAKKEKIFIQESRSVFQAQRSLKGSAVK